MAMGLEPSMAWRPKVGTMMASELVQAMAMSPWSQAILV